jgi:predicted kinase
MIDISQKQLLLMAGFPGSGKSTLAKRLAEKFNLDYLSSDEVRKEVFKMSRYGENKPDTHDIVVSLRASYYDILYERALEKLKSGAKVVVDATHLFTDKREAVIEKISKTVPIKDICFIAVKTPHQVIKDRMAQFEEVYDQTETPYQSWNRVYTDFIKDEELGLITWPDQQKGIDVIISPDAVQPFFT